MHRRLAGQVDLGEEVLGRLGDPLVRPGAPVAQDRHRFIHRGVGGRQLWPHAGIVVPNSSRLVGRRPLESGQQPLSEEHPCAAVTCPDV